MGCATRQTRRGDRGTCSSCLRHTSFRASTVSLTSIRTRSPKVSRIARQQCRPPAAKMSNPQTYQFPSKTIQTDYPLIDNDPHFKRVIRYARPSDYVHGTVAAAAGPGLFYLMERMHPSGVGKGGFAQGMRLASFIGAVGGFYYFYQRSIFRFYGMSENAREVRMDMREMTDRVKAGLPLYGDSQLTPAMQGVAARQSRYSALFMAVLPWFNFVNHNQHGVDTAKYYQQAERELEEERLAKLAKGGK
ncbi:NADH-ubiquinone oxidoreductase complex I, 21 kDa subunit-domain-containing protein [Echria macrotheca]|uniref:NADH-ubiquinone oxidoreductase complex I, 21 kDa subunit-domain-containing protein n=1 Tax=Echria macrotheca TaxID=438768 RepID=A0AAJ0BH47_9PEZI|nr:NADH-ubiquinone oxidoreductase complex I, 21 kDa subunit-domain-containing protein [Echria macrotheca]